jgi:hypothetical protein
MTDAPSTDAWSGAGFQELPQAAAPPASTGAPSSSDPWAAAGFSDIGSSDPPKPGGLAGAWDEIKDRFNNESGGGLIGMIGHAYHLGSKLGSGEIDTSTPEGALAGADAALTFGPPTPGALGKLLPNAGRATTQALSPGQQAAATAERLGAPLPRGVASDSRALQSTTSAAASVPIIGSRIRNAVDATREAAGEAVGQSGVDDAIAANKQRINDLYDGVRGQIDPDRPMPMLRTGAVLDRVKAQRTAAGWQNPSQGLEQFENLATDGASFNGAQRARVDAREAGNSLTPNPGFNAADYNAISRAMTADIRNNLEVQGGQRALSGFDRAEQSFGPISEANAVLSRISRQRGPGAGLDELGFNPATGSFSLDKFVTSWNKIKPESRPFVPAPQHTSNIKDIFQMGSHIKSSMREQNTSHTSTPLIMMDLARDAILGGVAIGTGAVGAGSALGGTAMAAPAIMLMRWLSNPAKASAMAKFGRANYAYTSAPTTARQAALNIATRNLASNLGVPVADIVKRMSASPNANAVPLQPAGNAKE